MKPRSPLRVALAVAVAALCVGLAVPPALAHPPGGSDSDSETSEVVRPSLADAQAFVDRMITNRLDWLAAISAKVSADSDLNSAIKDKITSAIAQEEAALTALKTQVDSADSASACGPTCGRRSPRSGPPGCRCGSGRSATREQIMRPRRGIMQRSRPGSRRGAPRRRATKRARRHEKIGRPRSPPRSPSSVRPGRTGRNGVGLTRA